MSKNIILYGNGGSGNHGCEAIIRGTIELLSDKKTNFKVFSDAVEEDQKYGIKNIAEIIPAKMNSKKNIDFLKAYLKLKIFGDYTDLDGIQYLQRIKEEESKIALSVGGDNYCYPGTEIYSYLNKAYHKAGKKTILWGCSVEPEIVEKRKKDISLYDYIVARESITYEAVKKVNKNSILIPDPAFFMKPQKCDIDKRFKTGNVIGINASPMIISNEKREGVAYDNYKKLIEYIIESTDSYVALIPHVVWKTNDDRDVLKKLLYEFQDSERVFMVEDHTAPELKYIISRCRLFVGARTHSTIAAYSSGVPTLVVGYSVKARGIAKDLFGTEQGYVIPVQNLKRNMDLVKAFNFIEENEVKIREFLKSRLYNYLKRDIKIGEIISQLQEVD